MKCQLKTLLVLSFSLLFFQRAYSIHSKPILNQEKSSIELINDQLPIDDMLEKDMPQIEEQIREKFTLKERFFLKFAQKNRHRIKKRKNLNDVKKVKPEGDFILNPIGFFLGMFLLIFGVLIVYLFVKKDKKQARKSAWIGFLGMVLLFFLVLGLIFLLIEALSASF